MSNISKEFEFKKIDKEKHCLLCGECAKETVHSIVVSYEENGYQDCGGGNSVDWNYKNQIIQCLGCETVSFRTVSKFSEDVEYDSDGPFYPEKITYYPGRLEGLGAIEIHYLPYNIQSIYRETLSSIQNQNYILAGIGIRAIVETICKDLQASGNNLYEKIDSLKQQSIVTDEGANTLHKLRVLGNDSAHEVKAHNSKMLEISMKIIEHMLEGTYVIPEKVKHVFPKQPVNKP